MAERHAVVPASRGAELPETVVELARRRADEAPERPLYTFVGAGGNERALDRGGFARAAERIASALQDIVPRGGRALLLFQPGLDYITSFFGCLYAGVIPVPVFPPDPARLDAAPRLRAIAEDAQIDCVLTTAAIHAIVKGLPAASVFGSTWLAVDEIPEGAAAWSPERAASGPDEIAFLQYTSGSTGTPRGVVVTHGNLLHNLRRITEACQFHQETRGALWLPPYHDMGLVGGILLPLYAGFDMALMAPETFIVRPFAWLQLISRRRATMAGGPNFAFDLCARRVKPDEIARLDLSTWELAFSGAEPIRPEVLDRFANRFAACGFRREAFYPCYGLAESTLFVSGPDRRHPGPGRVACLSQAALAENRVVEASPADPGPITTLVGCGVVPAGVDLAIVDPTTLAPAAAGRVGEIWVRSGSVARGYWNRPDETERTFRARLRGRGTGTFLRTGDLGFLGEGGELFIAGRLKDVIILRGRNYYPQDVEAAAESSHPGLRPGRSVAFAIDSDEGEALAVAVELDAKLAKGTPEALEQLAAAVRSSVTAQLEISVHTVALLAPGTLLKTSSGKIRRRACRTGFVSGAFDAKIRFVSQGSQAPAAADSFVAPRGPNEQMIAGLFTELLEVAPVGAGDDFFALGGDSILATQMAARVRALTGVELTIGALLELRTVAAIAGELDRSRTPAAAPSPAAGASGGGDVEVIAETLTEIWREVLKRDDIDREQKYFDLGGTSLAAILMMTRIQERLGLELGVEALFEASTISALSALIQERRQRPRPAETGGADASPRPDGGAGASGRRGKGATPAPPLVPQPRSEAVPLSFAQQRLWFLDQFRPGATTYNIPIALRISGDLDVDALRRAFGEIVRRHESLRTTFALGSQGPVQVIHPPAEWALEVRDLPQLPDAAELAQQVASLASEEARWPFDLGAGPLLRTSLVRLAPQSHLLLVTMHHIVSDAWSMGVLVRELMVLYSALHRGEQPALPALPVQYADFAIWQRRWLEGTTLSEQLGYWKQRLADVPVLALPADRPRPAQPSDRGWCHFFSLQEVAASLQRMARDQGVTPFMVLLAAFQTTLARWSGQHDISVGTPIANRTRPQLEPLVGFFVNTLVMRSDLSGDPTFAELLVRVREMTLGAYGRQDIPFERLVEAMEPDRDTSHPPLFQVMFALQNVPLETLSLPGLEIDMVPVQSGTAKFDMTVSLMEWAGQLGGQIEYSTDLFDEATVARLAEDFQRILARAVADPDCRLGELMTAANGPPAGHGPPTAGTAATTAGNDGRGPRAPVLPPPYVAPRTPREEALARIWAATLSVERVGMEDHFFRLGGNSLASVLMLARVNEELGVEVPIERLFASPRLADLAAEIESALAAGVSDPSGVAGDPDPERESALAQLHPGGAGRPLFLVHALTGEVVCYVELARRLGGDRPIFGVQAGSGAGSGSPVGGVQQMARDYVQVVRKAQPQGPYLLGGWSMGGVVAFEMARQLEAAGEKVALLALVDSNAHGLGAGDSGSDVAREVDALVGNFDPAMSPERRSALRARVERYLTALRSYQPEPINSRITLLRPSESTTPEARVNGNGWRPYTRSGVEIHDLSGDHETILKVPHVDSLSERIQSCLSRADG